MRAAALTLATFALLATSPRAALAAERWAWPVRGEILTPYRNGSDPYAAGQHRGIDIGAAAGTAATAATAGSVTFAGSAGSSGLTISMRTADGRFDLSYLHLSALAVRKGDQVAAGDRLGAVGTSGTRSDPRPHLHFGVRDAASEHTYLDPLTFLSPPGAPSQPEAPRAAPVPVLAPARPAPAPAPVAAPRPSGAPAPSPSPAPWPLPAPARRPSPAARPGPARRPSPAREPVPFPSARPRALSRPLGRPAPRAAPALLPRALSSPDHVRAPAAGRSGERSPARAPGHGRPLSSLGQGSRPPAPPERAAASAPARDVTTGAAPDVGWLLACVGVGLAALVLAGPQAARRAVALVRTAADEARRPIFGRR